MQDVGRKCRCKMTYNVLNLSIFWTEQTQYTQTTDFYIR